MSNCISYSFFSRKYYMFKTLPSFYKPELIYLKCYSFIKNNFFLVSKKLIIYWQVLLPLNLHNWKQNKANHYMQITVFYKFSDISQKQ